MARMLFANMPVKDVAATKNFFSTLGFEFNEVFSDENTASMVISDQATVMFLSDARFKDFISDDIADTTRSREVLMCISADSRDEVDSLVDSAIAAGGTSWMEAQDHGFMYGRAFRDLDNHVWEVMWMDPSAVPSE
ncbi:VOC family protein [Rhodococcus sp. BP-252]|uniref:Glyoxalase n=1 Tax=Rhodococcoides kyotonense TaxID=398843 RepID=A0A177YDP1_9NOCA|nr:MULTISPECIES: VOC family protein [Rhodococcus]MBY6414058.1 VOC family protein [Rhodococcus sp. BP-320]MBY6418829.1 VOC family protein [Rhodococcus sp. BP-321]MBY6423426.1 VOC family protein [Rhodococcus sp. BP-324]MBY6428880.1 VOC family protein [Rhodococcus sp. BP-323]MBY6433886.1 VOC family protein [Rhodococcus sp. BP-322]